MMGFEISIGADVQTKQGYIATYDPTEVVLFRYVPQASGQQDPE